MRLATDFGGGLSAVRSVGCMIVMTRSWCLLILLRDMFETAWRLMNVLRLFDVRASLPSDWGRWYVFPWMRLVCLCCGRVFM